MSPVVLNIFAEKYPSNTFFYNHNLHHRRLRRRRSNKDNRKHSQNYHHNLNLNSFYYLHTSPSATTSNPDQLFNRSVFGASRLRGIFCIRSLTSSSCCYPFIRHLKCIHTGTRTYQSSGMGASGWFHKAPPQLIDVRSETTHMETNENWIITTIAHPIVTAAYCNQLNSAAAIHKIRKSYQLNRYIHNVLYEHS